MPIHDPIVRLFSRVGVDSAPASPGVYVLYDGPEVIFIGKSDVSIRSRLQDHLNGAEGPCTKGATHYKREVTEADEARAYEEELLVEYAQEHDYELPRCHQVIS